MSARANLPEVAEAAGVSQISILNHMPEDVAVPRDYVMQGARVLISVPTIRRIAAQFDDAGLWLTGNKLRDFAEKLMPTVAKEIAP